jgi:hypothetical protein
MVGDSLQEIEQNAFLENEPSLLPQDIVLELIAACDLAFDECTIDVTGIDITDVGRMMHTHCNPLWPTHRTTIASIMWNVPGRCGQKDSYDLMRDLAHKWASIMRTRQESFMQKVDAALRPHATDHVKTREITQIMDRFKEMLDETLTARVRDVVQSYMWRAGFFWTGAWKDRKYLMTDLPDQMQVTAIVRDLLASNFRNGWTQFRHMLTTSRLMSDRTHDTLTPELRVGLTAILGQREMLDVSADDVFDFMCPITLDIMRHPVKVNPCGHTFEREAILQWVRRESHCPLCRVLLQRGQAGELIYFTNYPLKRRIAEYLARHHRPAPTGEARPEWWNVIWLTLHTARHQVVLQEPQLAADEKEEDIRGAEEMK